MRSDGLPKAQTHSIVTIKGLNSAVPQGQDLLAGEVRVSEARKPAELGLDSPRPKTNRGPKGRGWVNESDFKKQGYSCCCYCCLMGFGQFQSTLATHFLITTIAYTSPDRKVTQNRTTGHETSISLLATHWFCVILLIISIVPSHFFSATFF